MHEPDEALDTWDDPSTAVVAHGLLNSMAVLAGTATTMLNHWDAVSQNPDLAREMLQRIVRQAGMASGVLEDLVRGVPPQVASVLIDLEAASAELAQRS